MKQGEDDEMEEQVFTVQGVMHAKDLPPFKMKPR